MIQDADHSFHVLKRSGRTDAGAGRADHRGGAGTEMSVRVLVGTSGYSYPEWKGNFYPKKIAAKDMLRWYAERFRTVEINNTFYR
ncbi:MAG: DUF72 domain-containing protein, partial [Acidobacteria bacterium]|nr:DUF72 domain-containing protein [Acidobacteriota bacterium]